MGSTQGRADLEPSCDYTTIDGATSRKTSAKGLSHGSKCAAAGADQQAAKTNKIAIPCLIVIYSCDYTGLVAKDRHSASERSLT